jgi:recombinational DNA repair protein RecR
VATELDVAELELSVVRARGQLVVLNERVRARTDFLTKRTPIQELARRIEFVEVQQELIGAQQEFTNGKARVQLLERRLQVGTATVLDLIRAQGELRTQEVELMLLSTRLKKMQASGNGKGDELAR